jgi:AcrR family transcriptional regulator
MNTKDRILDTAERLFARDGIEATSLRTITTEAGVNLAAVNYHFQSKDVLVWSVVARRMRPLNERRLALLDAYESAAGNGPLPLEHVLDAFLRPVVEISRTHAREFAPLMGRMYTEPGEFMERVYQDHLRPVATRFIQAYQRALPGLPLVELLWRLHFSVGVMAHTLGAANMLRVMSDGQCDPTDLEGMLRRMGAFMQAGLSAPVPAEVEHAAH